MRVIRAVFFMLLVVLLGLPASAEEWGDLSGRFVLDGAIPKAKNLISKNSKDANLLEVDFIADESLVVDSKSKGIANIAVYIYSKHAAVHPSYEKSANAKAELKFVKGRIEPHMLLMRTSQTMVHNRVDENVTYSPRMAVIKNQRH